MRVVAAEGDEVGIVLKTWELKYLAAKESGKALWDQAAALYSMPRYDFNASLKLKDQMHEAAKSFG